VFVILLEGVVLFIRSSVSEQADAAKESRRINLMLLFVIGKSPEIFKMSTVG
jgi:hypothetical protein